MRRETALSGLLWACTAAVICLLIVLPVLEGLGVLADVPEVEQLGGTLSAVTLAAVGVGASHAIERRGTGKNAP